MVKFFNALALVIILVGILTVLEAVFEDVAPEEQVSVPEMQAINETRNFILTTCYIAWAEEVNDGDYDGFYRCEVRMFVEQCGALFLDTRRRDLCMFIIAEHFGEPIGPELSVVPYFHVPKV